MRASRPDLLTIAAGSLLSAALTGSTAGQVPPADPAFDWWSYRPLERPPVPDPDGTWTRTPIDAFILRELERKGLTPAAEADRRTLIRRLSYDLHGLPPAPEDVDAFVADPDPGAYEALVDRLLGSSHYGERWARHWLDVVQYADTCGYDKDKLRPHAWPYRDYVIRSFNEDKPYTRFVQEQIAGDVLFPGEPDGILGLGFLAAGPWDFIGHVEVPESKIDGKIARNLDRDDMVSNTLNTFCSVTVQCARCHDHMFDPVTRAHYYGLQAVFAAVDRADRPYDLAPDVERHRRRIASELRGLRAELAALDTAAAPVIKDPRFGYHSVIAADPATEKWVEVTLDAPADVTSVVLRPCHDEFAGIGAGFGFPVRFRVEVTTETGERVTISDRTTENFASPGLSPCEIEHAVPGARRIRVTSTRLAPRSDDYILALAELQAFDRAGRNVALGASVAALDSIEAPVRWARRNLTDGRWPVAGATHDESAARRDSILESIERARAELDGVPAGRMVYAAATHFEPQASFTPTEGRPRPIHVLHRGDVRQPREVAVPGALPVGGAMDWRFDPSAGEGERRAALARWLTDDDHPLLWRSIVNRVWQHHFGAGIVATPNDFGRMGAPPTHPALLDWLACELRDGGQSLKRLHRLILTSSVYRQSSRFDATDAAIDGSNRYLWRMPRRRLDAESIRDSILSVSGALDRSMGGPGFHLFELERTEHSPHYEYHKFDPADTATHRRSIYRFVVRSQPDPWMTVLDCADSSQSTARREETLTSLQALSLLNSRFSLVMAERFAARLRAERDDLPGRVDRAMRLVTQRLPTPEERDDLIAYGRAHGLANLCRLLLNLSEFIYVD